MKAKIDRNKRADLQPVDDFAGTELKMSLYEMNQNFMASQKPLSSEELEKGLKEVIWDYVHTKHQASKYFMLLCKDISYFTVFVCDDKTDKTLVNEFLNCLEWVGKILSIEYNKENNVPEIWIKTEEGNCHCMYFFEYDDGIIPFRKG